MITKTRKFKRDDSNQAVIFSVILGIIFVSIVSFLIISDWRINNKRAEITKQIESLKKDIITAEENNKSLQANINNTQTESFWEEKAREQGYQKPGENTVVVLPLEEKKETAVESKNFFEKIMDKIKSILP